DEQRDDRNHDEEFDQCEAVSRFSADVYQAASIRERRGFNQRSRRLSIATPPSASNARLVGSGTVAMTPLPEAASRMAKVLPLCVTGPTPPPKRGVSDHARP